MHIVGRLFPDIFLYPLQAESTNVPPLERVAIEDFVQQCKTLSAQKQALAIKATNDMEIQHLQTDTGQLTLKNCQKSSLMLLEMQFLKRPDSISCGYTVSICKLVPRQFLHRVIWHN